MLTFDETLKAIKTLPTEKDIVLRAAKQYYDETLTEGYIKPRDFDTLMSPYARMLKDILILSIQHKLPGPEFIECLIESAAVITSATVKEGHEVDLLKNLCATLVSHFLNRGRMRIINARPTDIFAEIRKFEAIEAAFTKDINLGLYDLHLEAEKQMKGD
jgi:hypothetical protein